MEVRIGKYAFNSKEQAIEKIGDLLEDSTEDSRIHHCFVELGYEVLEPAVYGEGGEEISSVVRGDKYLVDVLWKGLDYEEDGSIDHPYGWKTYAVDIEGEGVHSFLGRNYQNSKIN